VYVCVMGLCNTTSLHPVLRVCVCVCVYICVNVCVCVYVVSMFGN
jgi:hypothetical protein